MDGAKVEQEIASILTAAGDWFPIIKKYHVMIAKIESQHGMIGIMAVDIA